MMADKKQVTPEEINKIAQNALKSKKIKIGRVSFAYDTKSPSLDALEINKPTDAMYLLVGAKQIYFKRNYYDMDKRTYALAKPRLRRIKRKQKLQKFWHQHDGAIVGLGIAGVAIVFAIIGTISPSSPVNKRRETEAEINAKVSAYEKTLPGYLEQKQQVENYRDSLQKVYGN